MNFNRIDSGYLDTSSRFTSTPVSKQAFEAFLKLQFPSAAEKEKMFASNLTPRQREILKARYVPIGCLKELSEQENMPLKTSQKKDERDKPLKQAATNSFSTQKSSVALPFVSSNFSPIEPLKVNSSALENPSIEKMGVKPNQLRKKVHVSERSLHADLKSYRQDLDQLRENVRDLNGRQRRVKTLTGIALQENSRIIQLLKQEIDKIMSRFFSVSDPIGKLYMQEAQKLEMIFKL